MNVDLDPHSDSDRRKAARRRLRAFDKSFTEKDTPEYLEGIRRIIEETAFVNKNGHYWTLHRSDLLHNIPQHRKNCSRCKKWIMERRYAHAQQADDANSDDGLDNAYHSDFSDIGG